MTCVMAVLFSVGANASELGDRYLLGEGDTLNIQVFDENELSGLFTGEDGYRLPIDWTGGCAGRNRREFRRKIRRWAHGLYAIPDSGLCEGVAANLCRYWVRKGAGFGTPQRQDDGLGCHRRGGRCSDGGYNPSAVPG